MSLLFLWNTADNLEKEVYQFYGDVYLNSHDRDTMDENFIMHGYFSLAME